MCGVPVSFPSYRVLSLRLVYGTPVCANALCVVVRSTRRAAEEPELVADERAAARGLVGRRQLARACRAAGFLEGRLHGPGRVGQVQTERPGERIRRRCLVITLTTPPPKRPYSAEIADVSTCTSSIASSMNSVVWLSEHVVVDVDAVHQEHVVVGEGRRRS